MILKGLISFAAFLALVSFSYVGAQAQVVGAVKDAAGKTKDVTVDAAKKTKVVVTDGLETAADKTKSAADATGDATAKGAKVAASKSKSFGNRTVSVTENIAGNAYEGGKFYTVTTWDGTKWVSKRVWFKTKKAADAVH